MTEIKSTDLKSMLCFVHVCNMLAGYYAKGMLTQKSKQPYERNIWDVLLNVPKVYFSRLLFTGIEDLKPKREIYYSTVFTLASAAIAYLGQLDTKGHDHLWLHLLSIITFGLAVLLVVFIHYVHTLFIISYHFYQDRAGKKDMAKALLGENVDKPVADALNDCFSLMSFSARLDLTLLLTLIIAIGSYITFTVINVNT